MQQQYFVASSLDHATQSLISGKRCNSTHEMSDISVTSSNAPNRLVFASVGWSKITNNVRSSQPSIIALMGNLVQSDIRGNKNSQLQMAIADFFHCENTQDRAVEYHRFATLLTKARLVSNYLKGPNRKQVGGEFLYHNYGSCSNQSRILVGKDAYIFDLSWMSYGATISRMPLVNNLLICSDVPPMVVDIHY